MHGVQEVNGSVDFVRSLDASYVASPVRHRFVVFTGRPGEQRTVRDDDFDLLTISEGRSIADELASRTAISEETANAAD